MRITNSTAVALGALTIAITLGATLHPAPGRAGLQ